MGRRSSKRSVAPFVSASGRTSSSNPVYQCRSHPPPSQGTVSPVPVAANDGLTERMKAAVPFRHAADAMRAAGHSAASLRVLGYVPAELRGAGFPASALRAGGFSAVEAHRGDYTMRQLRLGGWSAAGLQQSGFAAHEAKAAGFSATEMLEAGYSPREVHVCERRARGYTAAQMRAPVAQLLNKLKGGSHFTLPNNGRSHCSRCCKAGAPSYPRVLVRLTDRVSTDRVTTRGYTISEMRAGGYTAGEMRAGGYTTMAMWRGGFSATEMRAGGFNARELQAIEMTAAGYTAAEMRGGPTAASVTLRVRLLFLMDAARRQQDLIAAGAAGMADPFSWRRMFAFCGPSSIVVPGGYTASEWRTLEYKPWIWQALIRGGYTRDELVSAGWMIQDRGGQWVMNPACR